MKQKKTSSDIEFAIIIYKFYKLTTYFTLSILGCNQVNT